MAASTERILLATCTWLWLLACAHAAVSKAAFAVNKWDDNLQGDVIVLDASGMFYLGNHPREPAITTADGCAKECDKLPGCNAFTFCSNINGCGSGCAAFAAKKSTVVVDKNGFAVDSSQTKLPVLTFGPLNGGFGCSRIGDKDAWSYGTCSLKKVKNPLKPKFYAGGKGQGWVSGTINRPAKCGRFSTNVCRGCIKSSNANACFACAKGAVQVNLGGPRTAADGCAMCYSPTITGATQQRCLKCIKDKEACEACTATPYPKLCLDCVVQEGGASSGKCLACTSNLDIKSEAAATRCTQKCLPALRKQPISDYFCAACSAKDGVLTPCINCARKNPTRSGKCSNCATLAEKPLKCFQCATPPSMTDDNVCWQCASSVTKNIGACFKCAKNTKTKNRDRCGACSFYTTTLAGQDKCYKCLASNPADVQADCLKYE